MDAFNDIIIHVFTFQKLGIKFGCFQKHKSLIYKILQRLIKTEVSHNGGKTYSLAESFVKNDPVLFFVGEALLFTLLSSSSFLSDFGAAKIVIKNHYKLLNK